MIWYDLLEESQCQEQQFDRLWTVGYGYRLRDGLYKHRFVRRSL